MTPLLLAKKCLWLIEIELHSLCGTQRTEKCPKIKISVKMLVNVCIRKDSASKHPFQNFSPSFFQHGKGAKGIVLLAGNKDMCGFLPLQ